MSYKKIILSVLLLSVLTAATAGYRWWKSQDKASAPNRELPAAAGELEKLMRQYRRVADTLASVAGTIRIYDKENKEVLQETRTFRYIRCGAGFYMQLSSLQTFCDGRWLVQLDTAGRTILLGKAPVFDPAEATNPASLDRLFRDTAQFRTSGMVHVEGSQRRLVLFSERNPEIRSCTLCYDSLSYRLDRAEMERWKPGSGPHEKDDRIWLVKIDYQYPPAEKIDLRAKIKSIVTLDGRVATLAAAYRDYALHITNN
jgi:hypothetical protein